MDNYRNLKEKAYVIIKDMILKNELHENEYLEEKRLCEQLGISRTPLREAFSLLEHEGFVVTVPKNGTFVSGITMRQAKDLIQYRVMVEPGILEIVAPILDKENLKDIKRRIEENYYSDDDHAILFALDEEFHHYILSCCSNQYCINAMTQISDMMRRVRMGEFFVKGDPMRGAKGHIMIIDALLKDDIDEAVKLMRCHILSIGELHI